jgi:hypothetical protein
VPQRLSAIGPAPAAASGLEPMARQELLSFDGLPVSSSIATRHTRVRTKVVGSSSQLRPE